MSGELSREHTEKMSGGGYSFLLQGNLRTMYLVESWSLTAGSLSLKAKVINPSEAGQLAGAEAKRGLNNSANLQCSVIFRSRISWNSPKLSDTKYKSMQCFLSCYTEKFEHIFDVAKT